MSPQARRQPGIRIEVAPPPAEQALPRLDVAVLVGFAATGPLHLPVAVESVGQYAAVFGADAPLAWDAARGERVLAHLGPAVRGFFANGGRRCWVIRVARSAASEAAWRGLPVQQAALRPGVACSNRHAVPGVLAAAAAGGAAAGAEAVSRCEGSWSDTLRLVSALQQRSVAIDALSLGSPPAALQFHCRQALQAGDLLQFGDTDRCCAYARVDAVQTGAGGGLDVQARLLAAFERLAPGVPLPASFDVDWTELATRVTGTLAAPDGEGGAARLTLHVPLPARGPARSDWAQARAGASAFWLRIDTIQREPWPPSSPAPADATARRATLEGPAWRELGAELPFELHGSTVLRVLTLELRVADGGAGQRLRDIGLTPAHPRSWWQQPTDAERYRPRDGSADDGPPTVLAAPGFALAADTAVATPGWLPVGVEPGFGAPLAPRVPTGTALERDGLSQHDAELFVDPGLADATVGGLVGEAEALRGEHEPRRPLFGLHAALAIGSGGLFNEASLIALPDAVHPGWTRREPTHPQVLPAKPLPTPLHWLTHRGGCTMVAAPGAPPRPPLVEPDFARFIDCGTRRLAVPTLEGPAHAVPPGAFHLEWLGVAPGVTAVLEESVQPDFAAAREVYRGSASAFDVDVPLAGTYLYRVHAEAGDERSAASAVLAVQVQSDEWDLVDPAAVDAAALAALEARWLAVHRAALRLCAASGELFALLAMPRHFRTPQVLRHAQRLRQVRAQSAGGDGEGRADATAFGAGEAAALSYGALVHPWLQADRAAPQFDVQQDNVVALQRRTPRVVPPDGVCLGVMAARAALRGAWVAPANEPLKDVVALAPAVPAADLQALQDLQVNVLQAGQRGLTLLSADTLALDTELRPINVRRLLILLRRLALQRGARYVFEPLGPVLRRAVQRGFDELLTGLFRRGAFAGARAEQAFQVVTGDAVNTRRDADGGRFVVELRVAPALPMRFVTVRLTQSGDRLSVVEST